MADEKQKYVRTKTPKGIAQYPWINTPDTKFSADGDFKCNLIVPAKEAKSFIKLIDEEAKKAVESFKAKEKKPTKGKKPKPIVEGDKPYFEELDDDGEPTGNIIFRTKQRAKITTKKGDVIEKSIVIYDAKGKRIQANVGGGSTVILGVELPHYFVPASNAAGVSLRLQAVQVLDLVEFGGNSASSYGFGEEDGYEGEAYKPSKSKNNKKDSDDSEDESDEDEEVY
ncbi:hypothetical protein [Hyphomicrobium sp. ghe19]|uniref:hypothetical protein n=1 Tax=Hyphomicrobium sp. ghe19 TaxID=2682968 RepID=UPI001367472F|nr:hypothetical protein HYPP_02601 [Hyphomicrobium sp. ghe19]